MIRKISAKTVLDVMMRSLESMATLEANGIFLLSIIPHNILIKDGIIKILVFGNSGELERRAKQIKNSKVPDKELIYYPPEVLASEKINPSKVDVYMWGMSFYQAIAERKDTDLETELKLKRTDYEKFLANIKKVSLREDKDGSLMREFVRILFMVLDEDPNKRSSFQSLVDKLLDKEYYRQETSKLTGMYIKLSKEHDELTLILLSEV
jgi:serine/threonine protein kinase